ncbi:TonB-dependent receptor [uncultured Croceicoccus sp.]|uniref:TonB-dependent receptor n=1 Tax=uncultured Croceicoccus sp. TaxID=1295329 RepID=UPI0026310C79|nr:TonB-dependent receptor [uncultured Croceicoccus sp.]
MNAWTFRKQALATGSALRAIALIGAGSAAIGVATAPAHAQDFTRGSITGTVVDEAGNAVQGANVTLTSNEQGFNNTAVTDADGSFRINGLPTGSYSITVTSQGAVVVRDTGVGVVAGQNSSYRYIAGESTLGEEVAGGEGIVVVGRRIQVNDFAATQTGVTLDVEDLAQTVPVGRDQTSLILLAPGTTPGDEGFGNLASINGATVAENQYYINGLNVTDFRNLLGSSIVPFEFYRTTDVKTGGYQAEYGRALGGVISSITKSGSNEFAGGAVVVFEPQGLRSQTPNTFVDADSDPETEGDIIGNLNSRDYDQSLDGNFYLSGPIIKDRLFFYGLYNARYRENADTSFSGARTTTIRDDSPFFGGKLDFVIADGHRLEGTYFRDKVTRDIIYTGFDTENMVDGEVQGGLRQEFGGDNFIGTYSGQFTDWLSISGSYGQYNDNTTQVASPNNAYILSRIGSTRVVGGTSTGRNNDESKREFYRADADIYVDFFGEHHIRGGFDLEKLSAGENTTYNGTGYRYDVRSNLAIRWYYLNEGGFNTDQRAFYLQDSWSLLDNRVNLQLGVRNDSFKNYGVTGEKFYDSGDLWAPRLGASFDVFGDGATKLNVFYGQYYLPIATNTNIRLGGAETYYQQVDFYGTSQDLNGDGIPDQYTLDENGDIVGFDANFGGGVCPEGTPNAGEVCNNVYSDGTAGPTDTLVSQTLKPSRTDEYIIGLEHRIGDWRASINYTRRRLASTLEDAAIDAAVNSYCADNGIAGCEDVFTGYHQYVLLNPGEDVTVRLDGDCSIEGQCDVVTLDAASLGYPEAVRDYDAVQFELEKAYNGLYGFRFNYTYMDLRGNFEGAVKSDNNQTDASLTQDFDQPGFLEGATGPLANGRKHTFKLYGNVSPTEWLDLGANMTVSSPRKFSCIGNYFDSNNFAAGYGAASYYCTQDGVGGTPVENSGGTTSYLVPRGSAFESEWSKNVDLSITFKPFASNRNIQFQTAVFNVFNWKQETDYNEFGDLDLDYTPNSNPNYGRVTAYQAPRAVRFTMFMRFGGDAK